MPQMCPTVLISGHEMGLSGSAHGGCGPMRMRGSTRLKVDLGLVCIREGAGGLGAPPLLNSEDVLQRQQGLVSSLNATPTVPLPVERGGLSDPPHALIVIS